MNRYPLWKYAVMLASVLFGLIYTLPNFMGTAPSVQISSIKVSVKLGEDTLPKIQEKLKESNAPYDESYFERTSSNASIFFRFKNKDEQSNAKEIIEKFLNPDKTDPTYNVSLGEMSNAPKWFHKIGADPMYLGLDLKGGIHFLLQVDMAGAITKRVDSLSADIRTQFKDQKVDAKSVERAGNDMIIELPTSQVPKALQLLTINAQDFQFVTVESGDTSKITGTLTEVAKQNIKRNALDQNKATLENRVNELGVAEPVIIPQGSDRIVVQLPGVQDIAKAKEIIGRTATLEIRLADPDYLNVTDPSQIPFTSEMFTYGENGTAVVKRQVLLTGERISSAQAGFDNNQMPAVDVVLDDQGGKIMQVISRENLKKPMAIILFEKGKGEVLTVANIQSELGERFQITGMGTPERANDLALLMRAGSLAAPMDIIEERTIGPSMGQENIDKGFNSMLWGFLAVSAFMIVYYYLFGVFSVISLALNLLLLVAILSLLQATLTLPGIAAMALTLGMAIDSNVLINERIREELRDGANPQLAIKEGYDHAWATIMDSNITSLIAGLALLAFGSGPIRGFAVVHVLGIITSMFSAVFFSRGLANLWYGGRKVSTLSIGQVWKPKTETA